MPDEQAHRRIEQTTEQAADLVGRRALEIAGDGVFDIGQRPSGDDAVER